MTGWHAAGKEKKPLQEVSLEVKERSACSDAYGDESFVDETLFCVENSATLAVCAVSNSFIVKNVASLLQAEQTSRARNRLFSRTQKRNILHKEKKYISSSQL